MAGPLRRGLRRRRGTSRLAGDAHRADRNPRRIIAAHQAARERKSAGLMNRWHLVTACKGGEFAPSLFATADEVMVMVMSRALAVFRWMTNSNFVGCSTGNIAWFSCRGEFYRPTQRRGGTGLRSSVRILCDHQCSRVPSLSEQRH